MPMPSSTAECFSALGSYTVTVKGVPVVVL